MTHSTDHRNTRTRNLNAGEVRIWPLLLLDAKRTKSDGAFRLLHVAGSLDPDGSGTVSADVLTQFLIDHGVDGKKRKRWLEQAIELGFLIPYTRKRSGEIGYRLLSIEKAAAIIGCTHVGPRPAAITITNLLSRKWEHAVWGAARAILGDRPISRAKIQQLTGVPRSTQKYLEQDLELIRTANYVIMDTPQDYLAGMQEFDRSHTFSLKLPDKRTVLAFRMPDAVSVPLDVARTLPRGRTRKIRKHLTAHLDPVSLGLFSLVQAPKHAESSEVKPLRLFVTNERRAEQIVDWVRKDQPNVGNAKEVFFNITSAERLAQSGPQKAFFFGRKLLSPIKVNN